jgi:hypothetical protein
MQRRRRADLGRNGDYTCNDNEARDRSLPNTLYNKDDKIMKSLHGGQLGNKTNEHL